jgi:lipopolysaccharide export system protein LptA
MKRPLGVLFAAMVLSIAIGAEAQQPVGQAFGGFATNNRAPIDIQADSLTINDQKKIATYRGNVIAVQGDFTLRTVELEVHYGAKPAADGAAKTAASSTLGSDSQQIKRILAKRQVVMTSTRDQTATGDLADYEVGGQTVVLSGNVILKQGPNILKGDKLIVDLKTGESRMEATPSGGRIKTILHPQQKDQPAQPQAGKGR